MGGSLSGPTKPLAALVVLAVLTARRQRLLAFCILWYLGHLVIESSFIGLEIIYEQMKRIAPVDAFLVSLLDKEKNQLSFPLTIDEGIHGYRNEALEAARALTKSLNLSLEVGFDKVADWRAGSMGQLKSAVDERTYLLERYRVDLITLALDCKHKRMFWLRFSLN